MVSQPVLGTSNYEEFTTLWVTEFHLYQLFKASFIHEIENSIAEYSVIEASSAALEWHFYVVAFSLFATMVILTSFFFRQTPVSSIQNFLSSFDFRVFLHSFQ